MARLYRSRTQDQYKRKLRNLICGYLFWRQRKRRRRFWVSKDLEMRDTKGEYHCLMQELRSFREDKWKIQYRMTPQTFFKLVELIKPYIIKTTTKMRKPISPAARLGVTLRFLCSGNSYTYIAMSYRMSKAIVSKIIPETCEALWHVLQPMVMPVPSQEKWKEIAKEFGRKCHFDMCLGAVDGKHVRVIAPKNSGTMYYNYRKNFSIVLLAVADAHSRFVVVDVGAYGKQSDGSVLSNSAFGSRLIRGQLDLPSPKLLPGMINPVPYVFVGDEAFPLRTNLMRPFPGIHLTERRKIFNYRLSNARRVVEMAFGIMASRFRVFSTPMSVAPSNAESVIKACTVLHNFLRNEKLSDASMPTLENTSDADTGLRPLQRVGRPSSTEAEAVRLNFVKYFTSEHGSLPWQRAHVNRI